MMTPLPSYVVFGEALTDMVCQGGQHWLGLPGGSCWNVARVGARQGIPTAFAGAISQDTLGDALTEASLEAGLDLRYLQRVDRSPLLAFVTAQHPPQYFFVGDDSADLYFEPARLPPGWREAARTVHFGSLSLAREPLAGRLCAEAGQAAAAGKRIAFDPNFREPMRDPAYARVFAHMAGLAHYIKVSDEDLRALYPSLDEGAAVAALRAMAPKAAVLLTRGAHGMTLLQGDDIVEQRALPVEVSDTVGCGDAAMGGWMTALLRNPAATPAEQVHWAAATAAAAAMRSGAYAPTTEEVADLLREARPLGYAR
ncbi:carbohydrate kinase [Cupriavidus sp. YR651]|uniref:carbohydrate kinase family protein n=1 Tax=Cupriavidus sp. YR651 TaxID=1855315 RepID=UPI000B808D1E|nr:carbohydrate kinase [Cupriavidus sp. YR651]